MSERLVSRTNDPKHVVVVGGGPAGLKTAEIAARRGHRVTLFERSRRLGGLVNLAAFQPEHETIGEVTSYLEIAVAEYGVSVHLNVDATPDVILAERPDIVVVATGSEPNLPAAASDDTALARSEGRQVEPDIEGLDRPNVVSVDDVLSGAKKLSGHVIVIDDNGHWEAAGTAEYLANCGCRVTVIAGHGTVGENIEAGTLTLFHRRAAIKGISMRTSTNIAGIDENAVRVTAVFSAADAIGWGHYLLMPGDEETIPDVDWVVPVIGRRSREDLYLKMKRSRDFDGIRIERVGDCAVPRLIQSTIGEAFELARDL